jgi:hypothetical protein
LSIQAAASRDALGPVADGLPVRIRPLRRGPCPSDEARDRKWAGSCRMLPGGYRVARRFHLSDIAAFGDAMHHLPLTAPIKSHARRIRGTLSEHLTETS